MGGFGKLKAGTAATLRRGFVSCTNEFSVQRFVALRRRIPRKIARHCPFHQPRPDAPVLKDSPRTLDCVPESLAGILVTEKTVTAVKRARRIFQDRRIWTRLMKRSEEH